MAEMQGKSNSNKITEIVSGRAGESSNTSSLLLKKAKNGISPMRALRGAILTAQIISTGLVGDVLQRPSPAPVQPSSSEATRPREEMSVQELIKKAEDKYRIQISSPEKGAFTLADGTKVEPIQWTEGGIESLMKAFDNLPPYFYSPSPKNIEGASYVRLTITGVLPMDLKNGEVIGRHDAQCNCEISKTNPNTEIFLTPSMQGVSLMAYVVHEFLHRIGKPGDYKFVSDLIGVPQDANFTNFVRDTFALDDIGKIKERHDSLGMYGVNSAAVDDVEKTFIYGTTDVKEFFSVAGAFYSTGKEKFTTVYGLYMGKEKTTKLYNYMRDNIFKGKEYQDGEKLTQPPQSMPNLSDGSLNYEMV